MARYYLEYCGKALSFTFSIYPYSWKRVTLSRSNRIYRFTNNDTINSEALQYYNSLAPEIRLKRLPQESVAVKQEQPKPQATEPAEKPAEEPAPKKRGRKSKKAQEPEVVKQELPPEIVDTVSVVEEVKEGKTVSDEIISDTIPSQDSFSESVDMTPLMDEMALCEHLDMNYTEEAVRALAEELEVDVARLRSKDSVITRLVNEKYNELIAKLGKA